MLKLPLSRRTEEEIKYEIEEIIIPQMTWYGMKDGMNKNQINREINKLLGKNLKEQIKTIKGGSFDRDWS